MKKILVPTDFSGPAIEAYKFALELASITGMEIVVVHAVNLPVVATGFDVQPYIYSEELKKEVESVARESFERMKSRHPAPVRSVLEMRFNSVLNAITSVIDQGDIEIVVMGTHGADGLSEVFIGSNTEKVVRFSSVPVIAVRKAPSISSIRDIVFPNNLALDQGDLVSRVKNLQSFFNARLHLLWVNTPARFVPDSEVQANMRDFAHHYELSNYTLAVRSAMNEETGIEAYALEVDGSMIAMGTRGRRGLVHFFSGSVAEDVVNHIQCPVWTYCTRK